MQKYFIIIFCGLLHFGFSQNTFTNLEDALKNPESVKFLSLSKNRLKTFPVEIMKFSNLEYLDLSKNKLTTLPDTWAINKRFIMLPINRWQEDYERVLLGGLTCDSDDYYNSEQHSNAIYLPKFEKNNPLYIGFFNTGAYQETIGGYGGLKHCLIPEPRHILISRDENEKIVTQLFSEEQTADDYLKILGYKS